MHRSKARRCPAQCRCHGASRNEAGDNRPILDPPCGSGWLNRVLPLNGSAPAWPLATAVTPAERDTTGNACRAMARRVTASTLGVLAYVTGLKIWDFSVAIAMRI